MAFPRRVVSRGGGSIEGNVDTICWSNCAAARSQFLNSSPPKVLKVKCIAKVRNGALFEPHVLRKYRVGRFHDAGIDIAVPIKRVFVPLDFVTDHAK